MKVVTDNIRPSTKQKNEGESKDAGPGGEAYISPRDESGVCYPGAGMIKQPTVQMRPDLDWLEKRPNHVRYPPPRVRER